MPYLYPEHSRVGREQSDRLLSVHLSILFSVKIRRPPNSGGIVISGTQRRALPRY